jgi:hypothetical protein
MSSAATKATSDFIRFLFRSQGKIDPASQGIARHTVNCSAMILSDNP